jgi:putative hydrolase of HD superfamily
MSKTLDAVVRLGQVALAFGRVNRITFHEDGITPESDTDHTVMLGLIACALAQQWFPQLDRGLIAQLALIHDLVEVYAGDTPTLTLDAATAASKERREQAAARRLDREFGGCLPWVPTMICQYEQRTSPEARFVKAVDKLLPKITHILNGGATLTRQGITSTELADSWTRQARAVAGYAGDFPPLLALLEELVSTVAAAHQDPPLALLEELVIAVAASRQDPTPDLTGARERACRVCGCTETNACYPPCWWIEVDLCSACGPR